MVQSDAGIFQDSDYTLIRAGLQTLESRRDQLSKRFFPAQCPAGVVMSSLYATGQAVTEKMRHPNFETLKSRTVKFQNTHIPYDLTHYI